MTSTCHRFDTMETELVYDIPIDGMPLHVVFVFTQMTQKALDRYANKNKTRMGQWLSRAFRADNSIMWKKLLFV